MIVNVISEPWKHLVIDDFLEAEEFKNLIDYVQSVYDFSKNTKGYREFHKHNSNTFLSNLFSSKILDLKDKYFDELNYTNQKIPEVYYPFVELAICPPGFHYKRIHTDGDYKLMTTVLYVYPEVSDGTEIYSNEFQNSFVSSVEWKQNRALSFVAQRDNKHQGTWHNYGNSTKTPRVSLNLNLSCTEHGK